MKSLVSSLAGPIVLTLACASTTPTVPRGAHPKNVAGVRVAYPPPPARVEVIPLRRGETCLWRDGYWSSSGGEWAWVKGAWLSDPKTCVFAAPETKFESTPAGTTLVHRSGAWYEANDATKRCDPPPDCASEIERESDPADETAEE